MLYYDLQHFGEKILEIPTLPLFSDAETTINISLDTPEEIQPSLRDEVNRLTFMDIRIARSPELTWGGESIMRRMVTSLHDAIKKDGWDYYINISGSCIPLRSQEYIRTFLSTNMASKGWMGYCGVFDVRKPIPWQTLEDDGAPSTFPLKRVSFKTGEKIEALLTLGELKPITEVSSRAALYYKETGKNTFEVRSLTDEERRVREDFLKEVGFRAGRQWVILHRDIVEWLLSSDILKETCEICSTFFIPDEIFMQLVLFSERSPFKDKMCPKNFRYLGGGSKNLDPESLQAALKSPSLFARKIHPRRIVETITQCREAYHVNL